MADDIYTPDEWAPSPIEGPHDHKGYSEEKCVRCGWVMGMTALNCVNDDTPHMFPSQQEPELVMFQSDIPDPFPDVDNPWNEIERLRAERDEARAEASMKGYRLDDALDEIDRLRAKVAHLSAWPSFCDRPTECDVCGDVYRSEEARRG